MQPRSEHSASVAVRMLPFTKMHGISNDYIYVDCFHNDVTGLDLPALSRMISDRHCGIGSDGLILIRPPTHGTEADVRMEMYNADGSRGEMCGNGIRCVAKYALDHDLVPHSTGDTASIRVQTDRGVLAITAFLRDGKVERARVNMGPPILMPREIPVALPGERCVRSEIKVDDRTYKMTCVSMGNPHAVIFLDSFDGFDLKELGTKFEHHPLFPKRVNLHIATVQSRGETTMKTWERGSGITQACGTGACAVLVAGVLEDRLDRRALVHLPGGDLEIEWEQDKGDDLGTVFKTGPATEVFSGQWSIASGE